MIVGFRDQLIGPNAFYKNPDYYEKTREDFSNKNLMPVSYSWKIESLALRIFKVILSIIIFPIGIYNIVHGLIGLAVLPASTYALAEMIPGRYKDIFYHMRAQVAVDNPEGWIFKRLGIEVDGYVMDTVIMGKKETIGNGRWMLHAGGNGEFYECKLPSNRHFFDKCARMIADETHSNLLFFNYPSVLCSHGILPNRSTIQKAYHVMLKFLEDEENGIGAEEIILYGHSIGGGVMGDALESYEFRPQTRKVAVFSRTFNNLATTVDELIFKCVGLFIKIFGWNFNPARALLHCDCPHVVMQTGEEDNIVDDGIITREAALATALIAQPDFCKDNIMIIDEWHNQRLEQDTISNLGDRIEQLISY